MDHLFRYRRVTVGVDPLKLDPSSSRRSLNARLGSDVPIGVVFASCRRGGPAAAGSERVTRAWFTLEQQPRQRETSLREQRKDHPPFQRFFAAILWGGRQARFIADAGRTRICVLMSSLDPAGNALTACDLYVRRCPYPAMRLMTSSHPSAGASVGTLGRHPRLPPLAQPGVCSFEVWLVCSAWWTPGQCQRRPTMFPGGCRPSSATCRYF